MLYGNATNFRAYLFLGVYKTSMKNAYVQLCCQSTGNVITQISVDLESDSIELAKDYSTRESSSNQILTVTNKGDIDGKETILTVNKLEVMNFMFVRIFIPGNKDSFPYHDTIFPCGIDSQPRMDFITGEKETQYCALCY
ncbi:MAG: hypothetical protein ACRCXZ_02270 [Patescibacteria group bacterium]